VISEEALLTLETSLSISLTTVTFAKFSWKTWRFYSKRCLMRFTLGLQQM